MNKRTLLENIHKIVQMYPYELEKYKNNLAISNVDEKARGFLYRAIELREEETTSRVDALAINGELKRGEVE